MREMMRRRRAAGGPAEDTFSALLGLTLRPRRLRDASELWGLLTARVGSEARDAFWSHPDVLPDADKLADWRAWVDAASSPAVEDDIDVEIAKLLSGTWEEESGGDNESDTTSGA
jgi:hypothetical protein